MEGVGMAWMQNTWYWLNDSKDGWIAVKLEEQKGETVILKTAEGEQYELPSSTVLRSALNSSLTPHANMLNMEELSEGAILNNLRMRYASNQIYTAIGSIIISINPYKQLPCYGPSHIQLYRSSQRKRKPNNAPDLLSPGAASSSAAPLASPSSTAASSSSSSGNNDSNPPPPHVYQLSDDAYTSLVRDECNQAILISGESGAGKTEATKLCLQYLAEEGGEGAICQQILEANPLLESFGNAKTVRNNNSSRFGKFCSVQFDGSARIAGARIESYLLEKSRVVNQARGERNYHAFYNMIQGATAVEREKYFLPPNASNSASAAATHGRTNSMAVLSGGSSGAKSLSVAPVSSPKSAPSTPSGSRGAKFGNLASDDSHVGATYANPSNYFRILNRGDCLVAEGQDDKVDYVALKNAMNVLNISSEEQEAILRILAAIMHVGNIDFAVSNATTEGKGGATEERFMVSPTPVAATPVSITEGADWSFLQGRSPLDLCCSLLKLDPNLCGKALLTRSLRIAGGETITVHNNRTVCSDNRDTLAKALYEALFLFIITRINDTLTKHSPKAPRVIGVLDIFGFENFDTNYFEQLCINYTNEKLNEHFIDHIFRYEQMEYSLEGLELSSLDMIPDHSLCVALIEERRVGILDMITEEIKLPRGSDENLLQRMHESFAPSANSGTTSSNSVSLRQAALGVYYVKPKTREAIFTVKHFAGDVAYEIERFMEKNKDALPLELVACIESSSDPVVAKLLGYKTLAAPPSSGTLTSPMSPDRSINQTMNSASSSAAAASLTLGAQFRSQLNDLISTLKSCRSNFLRCLKPNSNKIADQFDSAFVLRQMQYLGVKEVIAVRQKGFPLRMSYAQFYHRYKMLASDTTPLPAFNQNAVNVNMTMPLSPGSTRTLTPLAAAIRDRVAALFDELSIPADEWRLGITQVFFRSPVQQRLENLRDARFVGACIVLQAAWRGRQVRRRVSQVKEVAKQLRLLVDEAEIIVKDAGSGLNPSVAGKGGNEASANLIAALEKCLARVTELESVMSLPTVMLTRANNIKTGLVELSAIRRVLHAAIQSKDIALLQKGLDRANELVNKSVLSPQCPDFITATSLLTRLEAYKQLLSEAMETHSIPMLQQAMEEAKSLALEGQNEREAKALLQKLLEEQALVTKLESLLAKRGTLDELSEAFATAEGMGLITAAGAITNNSAAAGGSGAAGGKTRQVYIVLAKAQTLANLLKKEQAMLSTLTSAISSRTLAQLDSSLAELSADAALNEALKDNAVVQEARTLQSSLRTAAQAGERAESLRASLEAVGAARSIGSIEANLASLRALGPEGLQSLGDLGVTLQQRAEEALFELRSKAAAISALQLAMEDRSPPALEEALEAARELKMDSAPEFAQAAKLLTSIQSALSSLHHAATAAQPDLDDLQRALDAAAKLGLGGPAVDIACKKRDGLLRNSELVALLKSAVEAGDEGMLTLALDRARAGHITEAEPAFLNAQASLDDIREKARKALAEREKKQKQAELEAEEAKQAAAAAAEAKRISSEAEAAQAREAAEQQQQQQQAGGGGAPNLPPLNIAAANGANMSIQPPNSPYANVLLQRAPSIVSSSANAPQRAARTFNAEHYRSRHLNVSFFPQLRTPDDFARGKLFGRQELKASMLSWSKDPLPRSLTKFSGKDADDLNTEALLIFKSIQGFQGDRVYSFPDSLGCEVISKGLQIPELRDEIYLQLVKQIQHNTTDESVRKGWQLLALTAETFPPSVTFKPFLYNFLLNFHDVAAYHSRNYVTFTLRTLQRDLPPKAIPPSIEHVTEFRERVLQSAEIHIRFHDGSSMILPVDPSMNAGICVEQIQAHIGMDPNLHRGFGLFYSPLLSPNTEPIFIQPTECPLDYIAGMPQQSIGGTSGIACNFLFQKRMWFTPLVEEELSSIALAMARGNMEGVNVDNFPLEALSRSDRMALGLMYFQIVHEAILLSHYDLSRADFISLCASYRRVLDADAEAKSADGGINNGVEGGNAADNEAYLFEIVGDEQLVPLSARRSLLPVSLFQSADLEAEDKVVFNREVEALIASQKQSESTAFAPTPISCLPLSFLRSFSETHPSFGIQPYLVQNQEIKALPAALWLGLSLSGLYLVDLQSKRILKAFKFAHLTGWAANAMKFSVRVLVARTQTQQLNFATKQGKRIASNMQAFIDVIVEQKRREPKPQVFRYLSPVQQAAPPLPATSAAAAAAAASNNNNNAAAAAAAANYAASVPVAPSSSSAAPPLPPSLPVPQVAREAEFAAPSPPSVSSSSASSSPQPAVASTSAEGIASPQAPSAANAIAAAAAAAAAARANAAATAAAAAAAANTTTAPVVEEEEEKESVLASSVVVAPVSIQPVEETLAAPVSPPAPVAPAAPIAPAVPTVTIAASSQSPQPVETNDAENEEEEEEVLSQPAAAVPAVIVTPPTVAASVVAPAALVAPAVIAPRASLSGQWPPPPPSGSPRPSISEASPAPGATGSNLTTPTASAQPRLSVSGQWPPPPPTGPSPRSSFSVPTPAAAAAEGSAPSLAASVITAQRASLSGQWPPPPPGSAASNIQATLEIDPDELPPPPLPPQ